MIILRFQMIFINTTTMSNEIIQSNNYSQHYIDSTIETYFIERLKVDPNNEKPTPMEIASMVRDLLNEYVNGDIDVSRKAFNYFVQCSLENMQMIDQLYDVMSMLKQSNESYKSLSAKYQVLNENYRTLQEEHEALMDDYLA
mgnify:CR=1 FL=1